MASELKVLNVGGGSKAIALPPRSSGFEHLLLDIDPDGAPDLVCDARELSTLKPGQFDAIYCSHSLEHCFPHDVPKVLAGVLHVLKPDGFAEFRVPELQALLATWAERRMDIEDVLCISPKGSVRVRDVIHGYGPEIQRSGPDFYAHRTGFTPKPLSRALATAGFPVPVRRPSRAFEFLIPAFRAMPTPA